MFRLWCVITALILCLQLPNKAPIFSNEVMGTTVSIVVPDGRDLSQLVNSVFHHVDAHISEWREHSYIGKLNRGQTTWTIDVPPIVSTALDRAMEIAALTKGAFDPTWAALWGLWDFNSGKIPTTTEIKSKLPLVNWRNFKKQQGSYLFAHEGMSIGLGGIGKGLALDECKSYLADQHINHYMIVAGGQVLVHGLNESKKWRVGIRKPDGLPHEFVCVLEITNTSVSTSGDYEKYFEIDGVRYHHIIDPRTGYPARGTKSVTVVTPDATLADALSTAFFVMGPEKAIALANSLVDVEALILDENSEQHYSAGMGRFIVQ